MALKTRLEELLHLLAARGHDASAALAPGASQAALADAEAALGIELPEDAVTWFRRFDGTRELDSARARADVFLPPWRAPLSIEHATRSALSAERLWPSGWLPILGWQQGLLAVDCDPTSEHYGAVGHADTECGHRIVYASIGELVQTVLISWQRGVHRIEDGRPRVDLLAFEALRTELGLMSVDVPAPWEQVPRHPGPKAARLAAKTGLPPRMVGQLEAIFGDHPTVEKLAALYGQTATRTNAWQVERRLRLVEDAEDE